MKMLQRSRYSYMAMANPKLAFQAEIPIVKLMQNKKENSRWIVKSSNLMKAWQKAKQQLSVTRGMKQVVRFLEVVINLCP